MASRRAFIAGLFAVGMHPRSTWADVGNPTFLSAGLRPDGRYVLCGLNAQGAIAFEHDLPARGHAAAAHPKQALAVAFARRPGRFAVVIDCTTGQETARLQAPAGRHFYGHGTYSAEGDLLFTTENDFENAQGIVGVWDATQGYRRIGEFSSGGVGPHDIKLLPDGTSLVVANGGIETHPETGRMKLNLPQMRSNLSYVDLDGGVQDTLVLGPAHQRNSIRHLAVAPSGAVAFAMQWQGDIGADLPLLGVHTQGQDKVRFAPSVSVRDMQGYLGSIAVSADGRSIATTSPRQGRLRVLNFADLRDRQSLALSDVCGVAALGNGFLLTTGTGIAQELGQAQTRHALQWDNHLVAI